LRTDQLTTGEDADLSATKPARPFWAFRVVFELVRPIRIEGGRRGLAGNSRGWCRLEAIVIWSSKTPGFFPASCRRASGGRDSRRAVGLRTDQIPTGEDADLPA
jgi:hypothetical protein